MKGPSFYWGVGIENCWIAEHAEANRPPHRLLDVFLLMQHYTAWKEDLDRVADLGVNTLRYSVPWYKANPEPGIYDWRWISKALDYLANKLGVIPVIDLIHYGSPVWMDNSVYNHEFPQRFAEYAGAFARQFKGLVNHYTPYNEPQISSLFGGATAYWPPYLFGIDGWSKVGLNVGRGMVLASQALRAELSEVVLVSADCFVASSSIPPDTLAQKLGNNITDSQRQEFIDHEDLFPSCLAYGLVADDTPFGQAMINAGSSLAELAWFRSNAQKPDIAGFNYYPFVLLESQGRLLREALPAVKQHLAAGLSRIGRLMDRPVYLTETSAGSDDEEKELWMRACLDVILDLRAEGLSIVGMNWWPLFDVCKWDYRDSVETVAEAIRADRWNNGLYRVQEQLDGTLARVRTRAADAYGNLIAESQL